MCWRRSPPLPGGPGRPRAALTGHTLNAYRRGGVQTEHECTTVEEAAEKLARGFYILIREATNAHNLHTLLPLITPDNHRRICFCTDDRSAGDLLRQGSIDYMLREAIAYGLNPLVAFRLATLNTAECYGLHDRGALVPGRLADLMIFDNPPHPRPGRSMWAGGWWRRRGCGADCRASPPVPATIGQTMRVNWDAIDLRIPRWGRTGAGHRLAGKSVGDGRAHPARHNCRRRSCGRSGAGHFEDGGHRPPHASGARAWALSRGLVCSGARWPAPSPTTTTIWC